MESNQNFYQLKQGEIVYTLSTSLLGDLIKITCKNEKAEQYTRKFTLDELKTLDEILFKIQSPKEAIEFLDEALNKQKVAVNENEIEVIINIYFNFEGQMHQIDIHLDKVVNEENISSNNALNTLDTLAGQYTTSTNTEQYANVFGSDTEKYDNLEYNTDNAINGGDLNINDIEQNLNLDNIDLTNQLVENADGGQYFEPTNIENNLNINNFDFGLGQVEAQYGKHSVPIPSFDTNQYLNSYENTNTEQYNAGYGFTSIEPPMSPTPTVPMIENTIMDPFINIASNDVYTGNIADQYNFTQNTTTTTNTFDINEFTKSEPNTLPPVMSDNNANNFDIDDILTRPPTQTTQNVENKRNSIFSTPVTFSLPKRTNIKEEEPKIESNTFQSENLYSQNIYNVQSQPYSEPQFGNNVIQNQENSSSVVNVYQTKPVNKYKFGITLLRESSYPSATIEKVVNTTETKEVVEETNYNDERINQLEGDTNSLRNDHQQLRDKLNELTGEINLYKNQLGSLGKERSLNEVDALREENMAIKKQLWELKNLGNTSAEVESLRRQLAELDPLRRKVAEMEDIKSQLKELNDLRRRVGELDGVKEQVDEMNRLKAEVSKMNDLQNQLKEMNNLKKQIEDAENLRKTMEESHLKYEQDMQNLRNSQRIELLKMKKKANSEYNNKQLRIEKEEYITVKGDIIHNMDELEMITRKINKSNNKIILNLLYKATTDSDTAKAFHEKCDGAFSTLVLVETNKGKRFGGYTTCSWKGDCIDKKDKEAFIFSLDKMMTYDNIPGEDAIGCYPNFGPVFSGCQIRIYDNAFTKGGTTYERELNYNTEEDFELTGGERIFGIKEIEVYEVITQ